MDTSSDNIKDTRGAELETLIVALIDTLSKGNKSFLSCVKIHR